MSKRLLKTISEQINDDVVIEIGSINHKEAYLIMPDLKISDSGSVKSLKVRAYSSQTTDASLLHRLFDKVRR